MSVFCLALQLHAMARLAHKDCVASLLLILRPPVGILVPAICDRFVLLLGVTGMACCDWHIMAEYLQMLSAHLPVSQNVWVIVSFSQAVAGDT